MKYRIHIKADTDAAVKEELREVAAIITGLREATIACTRGYNTASIHAKRKYEKLADEWIKKHKVFYK